MSGKGEQNTMTTMQPKTNQKSGNCPYCDRPLPRELTRLKPEEGYFCPYCGKSMFNCPYDPHQAAKAFRHHFDNEALKVVIRELRK